jgi:anti-sigma regulatory factor (Ser/Thr protein kinase)
VPATEYQNRTSTTYRATFPAEPQSVGAARVAVQQSCERWGYGPLCDDARLIVSELVGNAVRHAGTDIGLTLLARREGLRMEVSDGSTRPVQPRVASLTDEDGRGLALVDALASHHGVQRSTRGKTVWAELDTPAA